MGAAKAVHPLNPLTHPLINHSCPSMPPTSPLHQPPHQLPPPDFLGKGHSPPTSYLGSDFTYPLISFPLSQYFSDMN